jgi:hypothetical protein
MIWRNILFDVSEAGNNPGSCLTVCHDGRRRLALAIGRAAGKRCHTQQYRDYCYKHLCHEMFSNLMPQALTNVFCDSKKVS